MRPEADSLKNSMIEYKEHTTNESNQRRVDDLNSSLNNSKIEIEGELPHSPRKYNNITNQIQMFSIDKDNIKVAATDIKEGKNLNLRAKTS